MVGALYPNAAAEDLIGLLHQPIASPAGRSGDRAAGFALDSARATSELGD
ncbi:MAG: hypothetical protein AAFN44_06105 [Pseudomonadota bacterium]